MLSPNLARIHTFEVVPHLPPPLQPLLEVAHNLWWSWHPEAVQLFKRIDRELWEQSHHNPVQMMGLCPQHKLDEAVKDDGLLTSLQRVLQNLRRHMERTPWLARHNKHTGQFTVAYFCAEFGLTECLQIYSGGLGGLAGDHLKSASELGMPLVGVGLLYRHGYFQQYLNADGWQQEYYPDLDFANLPVNPVMDGQGKQLRVSVQMPGREVHVAIWKVSVGRINLLLLDTNLSDNDPADREITGHLYGGDMDMRIRQEIVLGIGGSRALEAVGIQPDIYHMNEGHSAFLALERIRKLIEKYNISFDEARQQASASNIFTTHTPVPAGIDRFPPEMIQRYFKGFNDSLRLDMEGVLALGRENVFAKNEFFSMAVLAVRTSDWCNGVSALHGNVSRNMWRDIWPGVPEAEVPIIHVTNGVHARSWMSGDLIDLLDGYLGHRWQEDPADQTPWQSINEVPDEELWRIHDRCRRRLIIWARQQLRQQTVVRGADPLSIAAAADALNPNALTIGFARRFATYKRANLLLRDPNRLRTLLNDAKRPVQFLIAGKAHPADSAGKELIRQIVHFAREDEHNRRIVFIENYDINVARRLVQGCDVWLNTPRRGMEASGTSGMKAALNGVLNCSIRDGWWDEVTDAEVGWSVGWGEEYTNPEAQDDIESRALYDLLEKQIVPLFYDRDETGLPRRWVARMKRCISVLAPVFNTNRMVQEYAEKLYLPALKRTETLRADNLARAVELAHQKARLRANWVRLHVEQVDVDTSRKVDIGAELRFTVVAQLGELRPAEVRVQSYFGQVDNEGRIVNGKAADLKHEQDLGGSRHRFAGAITAITSGRFGFAIRIIPGGELFEGVIEPGLIHWDNPGVATARIQARIPAESAA